MLSKVGGLVMERLLRRDRSKGMRASIKGFTIVELLIVIVIIGILAAIVIVAYNGVNDNANKTKVASELRQWQKLYEGYKATYGTYPAMANGSYCLGTGFSTGYCSYIYGPTIYSYPESAGAPIMTELSKIGKPPTNSSKWSVDNNMGPWVVYNNPYISLYTVVKGSTATDCPTGMTPGYYDSAAKRLHCSIDL